MQPSTGYSASSGASSGGSTSDGGSISFGSYGELQQPFFDSLPAWAWVLLAVVIAFVLVIWIKG